MDDLTNTAVYWTLATLMFPVNALLFPVYSWWYCMIYAFAAGNGWYLDYVATMMTVDYMGFGTYFWCVVNPWYTFSYY